ncbi:MAG: chorismate synthase, partial [Clostridia bacterium]|nr:chorismate synthase [Clostridia bacterium]
MSTAYGKNIRLYIDGNSHGPSISMKLEGFPAGLEVDMDELCAFLARRAPGGEVFSTKRKEDDAPVFLSGIKDGVTTGGTIHAVIYNKDAHPSDYDFKDTPRPSHADYTAVMKYGKDVDISGGGHFSGRLTAPYCIAGALCKQYLKQYGIDVFAHIFSVGDACDTPFDAVNVGKKEAEMLKNSRFAVLDAEKGEKIKEIIDAARRDGDSVGGIVECAVTGCPAGLGEHLFAGVEGRIADALYSIPAVKGVDFGAGFGVASMKGSECNDAFTVNDGKIATKTNNCGGILGGMTSGMPIICRAAFKPTPSISKEQCTVSISKMEECKISIHGRHDPCITVRAVAAVEAAVAVAVMDIFLDAKPNASTELSALRERIDACDRRIVEAFTERMDIALGVANYKREHGLPVLDAKREASLLEKIEALAGDELAPYAKILYGTILSVSRARQHSELDHKGAEAEKLYLANKNQKNAFSESVTVAVQGTSGAFSETAARALIKDPDITFEPSFASVVQAVVDKKCRYGVLPIENSTAGAVTGIYSLLLNNPVYIIGTKRVKIEHNLLANAGADISAVKEICSHEQALNQCSEFIKTLKNVKITYVPNTAYAAKYVKESGRTDIAAISSLSCADIYGLDALSRDIQDKHGNSTRFVLISAEPEVYAGADTTDIIASTENKAGALNALLTRINTFGINIKKLESMPYKDGAAFYLSLEAASDAPELYRALSSA